MIPSQNSAARATTFVIRSAYLMCMKNKAMIVALVAAITTATTALHALRSYNDANAVSAVNDIRIAQITT